MGKCVKCGAELEQGARFCPECGERQIEQTNALAVPEQAIQGNVPEQAEQGNAPEQAMQENTPERAAQGNAPEQSMPTQAGVGVGEERAVSTSQQQAGARKTADGGSKAKKVIPQKKRFVGLGCGAAALLLVIILVIVLSGGGYTKNSDAELALGYSNEEQVQYAFAADGTILELPGVAVYDAIYSLDRAVVAVLMLDSWLSDEKTLYVVDQKNGVVEVAEEVTAAILADSGKGLAYISGEDDELYWYSIGKQEEKRIAKGALYEGLVISPDGETVGFTKESDLNCYLSKKGGEAEKVASDARLIAMSDGGKYLYYIELEDGVQPFDFFVSSGDEKHKLASKLTYSEMSKLYFNETYTQLLYCYEGKTYATVKGGDRVRISTSRITGVLLPINVASRTGSSSRVELQTLGVSDLEGIVCVFDYQYCLLGKDFSYVEIVDADYDVMLSEDGDSMLYTDFRDDLYLIESLKKSTIPQLICEDAEIRTFTATSDLSKIYFVNDDEELMYIKGKKEPQKVADDVYYNVVVAENGSCYFLVDYKNGSGTLYISTNGKERKAVSGADEVAQVGLFGDKVVYYEETDEGYDLYLAKPGKSFERLLEDLSFGMSGY